MGMIDSIIDETDGLSDIRRSFYKVMLHARYSHILESAYAKLQTSRAKPEKLIFEIIALPYSYLFNAFM